MKRKPPVLNAETRYVIEHLRTRAADLPMSSIHVRPWGQYGPEELRDREYRHLTTLARLNVVTLPAGTAVADAVTLLCLAVPAVYRDLWHSVSIDERHYVEWEGTRRA